MVCLKIRQLRISRVANEAAMISTDGNNRKKHKQLTPVTLFIVGHKEGAEPNEMYSTNKCNFVELGGGVGDVSSWCHDGASIGFGF